MEFSKKLSELLLLYEMTQADLCKRTGIPSSLMANYYSGKKSPALSNAIVIADAFGISLDELVGKTQHGDTTPRTLIPYEKEFIGILEQLKPESKDYLLSMATGLLGTQEKLLKNT